MRYDVFKEIKGIFGDLLAFRLRMGLVSCSSGSMAKLNDILRPSYRHKRVRNDLNDVRTDISAFSKIIFLNKDKAEFTATLQLTYLSL